MDQVGPIWRSKIIDGFESVQNFDDDAGLKQEPVKLLKNWGDVLNGGICEVDQETL